MIELLREGRKYESVKKVQVKHDYPKFRSVSNVLSCLGRMKKGDSLAKSQSPYTSTTSPTTFTVSNL